MSGFRSYWLLLGIMIGVGAYNRPSGWLLVAIALIVPLALWGDAKKILKPRTRCLDCEVGEPHACPLLQP